MTGHSHVICDVAEFKLRNVVRNLEVALVLIRAVVLNPLSEHIDDLLVSQIHQPKVVKNDIKPTF